jgi:hypothetical protein
MYGFTKDSGLLFALKTKGKMLMFQDICLWIAKPGGLQEISGKVCPLAVR